MTTDDVRDHFVYHVFDADGQILYIGCTKNLKQRWTNHRSGKPAVVVAFARCKIQGPYTRTKALQIEKAAIFSRRPLFNGGLPREEAQRRHVIAAHQFGRYYRPGSPGHEILVSEGLVSS